MKYFITISIEPSAPFGVPQEGVTVIAGKNNQTILSPALDSRTGVFVGHGSLPKYREDSEAINLELSVGEARITIKDNFAWVELDASSSSEAYDKAVGLVDKFLQQLSLNQRRLYEFETKSFESEDGKLYPIPKTINFPQITTFNLEELASDLNEAACCALLEDVKLAKAIEYFQVAMLIFEHRSKIASVLSRNHHLLIASAFLNLWKAVSTIVGDPGVDKDYQKRYRQLGFNEDFFKNKIEKVRDFRNAYDIAHYSIDPSKLDHVEANYGEAAQITSEVLTKYRSRLITKAPDSKD